MATNMVQKGDVVTVVSPTGGVSSGDPVLIGASLFGVATHDAIATADLELAVTGVWTLPADTNLVIAAGDRVFWDSTNGWVDKTATSQAAAGIAVIAKVQAGTTVDVLLGGSSPVGA